MQACVDADVTKHLRKGRRRWRRRVAVAAAARSWWLRSYVPRCISAAVNRAIQLAGNKKCCSGSFIRKSEKKETEKEGKQMNVSLAHNSHFFRRPPRQRCLQIPPPQHTLPSLHPLPQKHTFQLGHVSKRRGLFICTLAARKFCSLMAFKTGSGRQLKNKERKKGRSEKRGG